MKPLLERQLEELAKDIAIVAHPDTRDLVEKRALLVLRTCHKEWEEEVMKLAEEMKISGDKKRREESSEFMTPRMYRALGYNNALSDLQAKLQAIQEKV